MGNENSVWGTNSFQFQELFLEQNVNLIQTGLFAILVVVFIDMFAFQLRNQDFPCAPLIFSTCQGKV